MDRALVRVAVPNIIFQKTTLHCTLIQRGKTTGPAWKKRRLLFPKGWMYQAQMMTAHTRILKWINNGLCSRLRGESPPVLIPMEGLSTFLQGIPWQRILERDSGLHISANEQTRNCCSIPDWMPKPQRNHGPHYISTVNNVMMPPKTQLQFHISSDKHKRRGSFWQRARAEPQPWYQVRACFTGN